MDRCDSVIARFGLMISVFGMMATVLLPLIKGSVEAGEKITIGSVEEVVLLPWGVRVLARIDTGAATSSLDVCEYRVKGKFVTSTLANRCGGAKVRLPLVEMRYVRSAAGGKKRPVVEMEICVGSRQLRTEVTLTDRSRMDFPLLIGRNTLEGHFIVDVSHSMTIPPVCPGSK